MSGSRPVKSSGGVLVVSALVTEQVAITAPHEKQPLLNQTDGPAAQIVCFPASIRNANFAEQAFRDFAIAIPFQPPIQRTQSEDEAKTSSGRWSKRGRSERALLERQPKSMCCLQADIELAVER